MAEDWSLSEVEATVSDYFEMLVLEVRGVDYNKSAHRRRLMTSLNHRTDAAIERKRMNISAALLDLGFVPIDGYKPLPNYQQLLFDIVEDQLIRSDALRAAVQAQVSEPAVLPTVDDILATLVDPPTPDPNRVTSDRLRVQQNHPPRLGVNYLAIEAANRSLGSAGEEFALRFEVARLLKEGQDRLADQVERVSQTRGDGLGYDLLSFEVSGQERFIEVKTTSYGASTPFFVSRNELLVSQQLGPQFHLYRAFSFRRHPRLFTKVGAIDQSFELQPSQFRAAIG